MTDKWGSNRERRTMLLSCGYTPAIAMTVLTRIAHWKATDGQTYHRSRGGASGDACRGSEESEPMMQDLRGREAAAFLAGWSFGRKLTPYQRGCVNFARHVLAGYSCGSLSFAEVEDQARRTLEAARAFLEKGNNRG